MKAEFQKASGRLVTPAKKRPGSVGKRTRTQVYDGFTKSAVRKIVHGFFLKSEIPTIQKVRAVVNADDSLPNFGQTAMYTMLKALNFVFRKRGRNSLLIERDDIVLWRRRYLRLMKHYRERKRTIYYLDETWVNAGHTKSKVWQDTTVKTSKQAFLDGLSAGLKAPSGKGGRLIILHAGNEDGFVPNAQLVFHAKKGTGDYHDEMDGDRFEKWFVEQFLPNIKPNSVIVMDNASYHSVKLEKIPTMSSRKNIMQDWLTEKEIPWDASMLKRELLELINKEKSQYDKYRIDNIALENGHTILRLPPYHCELNPIELVWSMVKGFVASENHTFKLKEVEALVPTAFAQVTNENWANCVEHVKKVEESMWLSNGLSDIVVENCQFSVNDSSDEDSDMDSICSDASSMSGIEERD